jgi:hypothetical protein
VPILMALWLGAAAWVVAFAGVVMKSYVWDRFFFPSDRAWRFVVALVTAGFISAAWLATRRVSKLDRLNATAAWVISMTLLILMILGMLAIAPDFAQEPRF